MLRNHAAPMTEQRRVRRVTEHVLATATEVNAGVFRVERHLCHGSFLPVVDAADDGGAANGDADGSACHLYFFTSAVGFFGRPSASNTSESGGV